MVLQTWGGGGADVVLQTWGGDGADVVMLIWGGGGADVVLQTWGRGRADAVLLLWGGGGADVVRRRQWRVWRRQQGARAKPGRSRRARLRTPPGVGAWLRRHRIGLLRQLGCRYRLSLRGSPDRPHLSKKRGVQGVVLSAERV